MRDTDDMERGEAQGDRTESTESTVICPSDCDVQNVIEESRRRHVYRQQDS